MQQTPGPHCPDTASARAVSKLQGVETDGAALPYIDEHSVRIDAPRGQVWSALQDHTESMLRHAARNSLIGLLDPRPRSGFAVADSIEGRRLSLSGRHRFSRYQLVFDLEGGPAGSTTLRARSYAVFPGVLGGVYRTLVIGTRLHVVATNQLLRKVRAATVA